MMSVARRIGVVAAGLAMSGGLLAGCGGGGSGPITSPSYAPVVPQGVQDPAVIPTTSAGPTVNCGVATASLRPPTTMPPPGTMPAGSTMARILDRKVLRVGVSQNTYLFGYRTSDGEIVGFDIEIAREVAKAIFGATDYRLQFIALTSAQRIPYLQEDKVDLVAQTMTINCDRWQQVNFSSVYYNAGQTVLVPNSSTANGLGDLGGKKVCAAAGSTSIRNIAAAEPKPIPVSVADWTDCLVLLHQGQVDAISTDDTILNGLKAQDTTTRVIPGTFTEEPYGMAMKKGEDEFTRFVNGVLENIRANGRWATIYKAELRTDTAPTPPAATYKG